MGAYVVLGIVCLFVFIYGLIIFVYNKGIEKGRLETKLENLKNNAVLNDDIAKSLNDNIDSGADALIDELRKNN